MDIDGSISTNQDAGAFEGLKLFTKDRYEWGFSSNVSPISRHLALLNLIYTRNFTRHNTYITPHLYIWLLFIYFDLANRARFQNLVGSMLERGIPEYIRKKEKRRHQNFSQRNAMWACGLNFSRSQILWHVGCIRSTEQPGRIPLREDINPLMIEAIYILYRSFLHRRARCSPLLESFGPTCGKRPFFFFFLIILYDKTSATYSN